MWRKPIRRYSDSICHRALLRELGSDEPLPEDLGSLAEHVSAREWEAAEVEHAANDICLAWLLNDTLFERGWETTFEGEIIGVIGSGLFVRFGEVFEGYLPARRLPGDYFEMNPLGTRLVGRRGGSLVQARRRNRGARGGDTPCGREGRAFARGRPGRLTSRPGGQFARRTWGPEQASVPPPFSCPNLALDRVPD